MSTSKHPKGLYLIFATSTAERFSYYGMRAIFILFLTQALLFDKEHAASIYGSYTGLVYLTPLIGTKYSGGSKWGNRGCIAGPVIGIFLFPPWGIIFGPLVGAVIGELLGGKLTHEALKAGLGAFVGFLLGVILKVSLCGYFVVVFISALF